MCSTVLLASFSIKAWARFVGIVNDRERDDQLFATMGRQACAATRTLKLCPPVLKKEERSGTVAHFEGTRLLLRSM